MASSSGRRKKGANLDIDDMERRIVEFRLMLDREKRRCQAAKMVDKFEQLIRDKLGELNKEPGSGQLEDHTIQLQTLDKEAFGRLSSFLRYTVDKCSRSEQHELIQMVLREALAATRRKIWQLVGRDSGAGHARLLEPFCFFCANTLKSRCANWQDEARLMDRPCGADWAPSLAAEELCQEQHPEQREQLSNGEHVEATLVGMPPVLLRNGTELADDAAKAAAAAGHTPPLTRQPHDSTPPPTASSTPDLGEQTRRERGRGSPADDHLFQEAAGRGPEPVLGLAGGWTREQQQKEEAATRGSSYESALVPTEQGHQRTDRPRTSSGSFPSMEQLQRSFSNSQSRPSDACQAQRVPPSDDDESSSEDSDSEVGSFAETMTSILDGLHTKRNGIMSRPGNGLEGAARRQAHRAEDRQVFQRRSSTPRSDIEELAGELIIDEEAGAPARTLDEEEEEDIEMLSGREAARGAGQQARDGTRAHNLATVLTSIKQQQRAHVKSKSTKMKPKAQRDSPPAALRLKMASDSLASKQQLPAAQNGSASADLTVAAAGAGPSSMVAGSSSAPGNHAKGNQIEQLSERLRSSSNGGAKRGEKFARRKFQPMRRNNNDRG